MYIQGSLHRFRRYWKHQSNLFVKKSWTELKQMLNLWKNIYGRDCTQRLPARARVITSCDPAKIYDEKFKIINRRKSWICCIKQESPVKELMENILIEEGCLTGSLTGNANRETSMLSLEIIKPWRFRKFPSGPCFDWNVPRLRECKCVWIMTLTEYQYRFQTK